MPYKDWNDFFSRASDDKKALSRNAALMEGLDSFEDAYRAKFGIFLDHHALALTKEYGSRKAWRIIRGNIASLDAERRLAAEKEKQKYEFHDIPDGFDIPF